MIGPDHGWDPGIRPVRPGSGPASHVRRRPVTGAKIRKIDRKWWEVPQNSPEVFWLFGDLDPDQAPIGHVTVEIGLPNLYIPILEFKDNVGSVDKPSEFLRLLEPTSQNWMIPSQYFHKYIMCMHVCLAMGTRRHVSSVISAANCKFILSYFIKRQQLLSNNVSASYYKYWY